MPSDGVGVDSQLSLVVPPLELLELPELLELLEPLELPELLELLEPLELPELPELLELLELLEPLELPEPLELLDPPLLPAAGGDLSPESLEQATRPRIATRDGINKCCRIRTVPH